MRRPAGSDRPVAAHLSGMATLSTSTGPVAKGDTVEISLRDNPSVRARRGVVEAVHLRNREPGVFVSGDSFGMPLRASHFDPTSDEVFLATVIR